MNQHMIEDKVNEILANVLPEEQEFYFEQLKRSADADEVEEIKKKIQAHQYPPIYAKELEDILGLTIKKDHVNKVATFLCQLSAYSEDSQLNLSFNGPSSTGKSYIPLEISSLFPKADLKIVGYCSPTAFFHDVGEFDKEKKGYVVDLSRKILIFLDQPHTQLLERLRPLLSHDQKEIEAKITDKSQKHGLKTKNIYLKGYPAVIFCSAGLKLDEQEATRFLLLSPETSQEKIREAIYQKLKKETNPEEYVSWLKSDPQRQKLKDRIGAIKAERIKEIRIGFSEKLERLFFEKNKTLKPRHSRDISRIVSLIKTFALLNLWDREKTGSTLTSNEKDIEEAFMLWDVLSESQELNLSPYVYNFYKEIILSAWEKKRGGLTRLEITKNHYEVYGRPLVVWQLNREILPMLESAGLIYQEPDPDDKRRMLVYPTTDSHISQDENYMGMQGGVDSIDQESIFLDVFTD